MIVSWEGLNVNVSHTHWKATLVQECCNLIICSSSKQTSPKASSIWEELTNLMTAYELVLPFLSKILNLYFLNDIDLNWSSCFDENTLLFLKVLALLVSINWKSFAKFLWVQSLLPWSRSALWLIYVNSPVSRQTFIEEEDYLMSPKSICIHSLHTCRRLVRCWPVW